MSQVPVSFRVAPFPTGINYTPQEFAEAFAARLAMDTPINISFFVSGPTAPTSNVGPWLKNGVTWYVFDSATAAYVPEVIESISLKYIFQNLEPDHNSFTFWGKLDVSGKAQSIQYYFNGAWHDVYEDTFALYTKTTDMNTAISTAIAAALVPYSTTAQMNTAIQTAIADIPSGKGTFRVAMGSPQNQPIAVSASGDITPVFDTVMFDPNSCWSSNKYTVPANGYYTFTVNLQIQGDDNKVTNLYIITGIFKNAGVSIAGAVHGSPPTPYEQRSESVSTGAVLLNAGDTVYVVVEYDVTVTAPSGITIGAGGPAGAYFSGWQVGGV